MNTAYTTLLKILLSFSLLGTLNIANVPPTSAQEMHPGPRATCPICRGRAANRVKARIQSDGKDPRTVTPSELRTYRRYATLVSMTLS